MECRLLLVFLYMFVHQVLTQNVTTQVPITTTVTPLVPSSNSTNDTSAPVDLSPPENINSTSLPLITTPSQTPGSSTNPTLPSGSTSAVPENATSSNTTSTEPPKDSGAILILTRYLLCITMFLICFN
ncbi:hypothetical protein MTP99_001444 [Tenebrio molitor]|nr:hypothetical protein MTP99_001444 [Tenebrio molitor]